MADTVDPCGNCCTCFESPSNKILMESAVARYSDRSSFANSAAQDASVLLNAQFQAVASQAVNTSNEDQLQQFIAGLNAVMRTPTTG